MTFVKGMKKHPLAGMKKGYKTKGTTAVKEKLAAFIETSASDYLKWLREIEDPAKRCDIWLKTVEFHIPKLSRTEVIETPESVEELSDADLDRLIAEHQSRLEAVDSLH